MTLSLETTKDARRVSWRRLAGVVLGRGGGRRRVLAGASRRALEGGRIETAAEARERPAPSVEVVRPQAGGIPRTIQQPASIHAFESVDLYAMVSGYLKTQEVDIGSRIKKGEVLAEINVPRDAKAVEEAASLVEQARAQVVQADARIRMAEAQRDAAAAAVKVAESDLDRLVARREFAEKQYARVNGLVAERAADAKLADEQMSDLDGGGRCRADRFGRDPECQGKGAGRRGRHRASQGRRRRGQGEPGRGRGQPGPD